MQDDVGRVIGGFGLFVGGRCVVGSGETEMVLERGCVGIALCGDGMGAAMTCSRLDI